MNISTECHSERADHVSRCLPTYWNSVQLIFINNLSLHNHYIFKIYFELLVFIYYDLYGKNSHDLKTTGSIFVFTFLYHFFRTHHDFYSMKLVI